MFTPFIKVKCPYCGHENRVLVEIQNGIQKREVTTCDLDSGGCDKDFVIHPKVEVSADVYKIELVE